MLNHSWFRCETKLTSSNQLWKNQSKVQCSRRSLLERRPPHLVNRRRTWISLREEDEEAAARTERDDGCLVSLLFFTVRSAYKPPTVKAELDLWWPAVTGGLLVTWSSFGFGLKCLQNSWAADRPRERERTKHKEGSWEDEDVFNMNFPRCEFL